MMSIRRVLTKGDLRSRHAAVAEARRIPIQVGVAGTAARTQRLRHRHVAQGAAEAAARGHHKQRLEGVKRRVEVVVRGDLLAEFHACKHLRLPRVKACKHLQRPKAIHQKSIFFLCVKIN